MSFKSFGGAIILLLLMACHRLETHASYWDNGQMALTYSLKDGRREGHHALWDQSGNLIAQGIFKDNEPWNGSFVEIERGHPVSIRQYRNGQCLSSEPLPDHYFDLTILGYNNTLQKYTGLEMKSLESIPPPPEPDDDSTTGQ